LKTCLVLDEEGRIAMIYLKSLAVGVVTFTVSAVLYISIWSYLHRRSFHAPPGVEVDISLGLLLFRPWFWLVTFLAFALGFYWEYWRHGQRRA